MCTLYNFDSNNFRYEWKTISIASVFSLHITIIRISLNNLKYFNDISRLITKQRTMPSTILRADNSANIGGIKPCATAQPEQVFHYKYALYNVWLWLEILIL